MKYALIVGILALTILAACVPKPPVIDDTPRTLEGVTITGNKATVTLPEFAPGQRLEYRITSTRKNATRTRTLTYESIIEQINTTTCIGWTKTETVDDKPDTLKRLACTIGDKHYQYDYHLNNTEWIQTRLATLSSLDETQHPLEQTTGIQLIKDVTTEAGTFTALKTTKEDPGRTTQEWHSPLVPIIGLVKAIDEQQFPVSTTTVELIAYTDPAKS